MEDRRVFARINARVPVRFLDSINRREGKADTLNFSANGLGLVTNERLSAMVPLEIWLDIPDQHEPLYVRGKVVWSNPLSGRVGVCLEKAELMGLGRVLSVEQRK